MPRGLMRSRPEAPLRSPLSKLPVSLLAMTSLNERGWLRVHCGTLAQATAPTPVGSRLIDEPGQGGASAMRTPAVVSPSEWRAAYEGLLVKRRVRLAFAPSRGPEPEEANGLEPHSLVLPHRRVRRRLRRRRVARHQRFHSRRGPHLPHLPRHRPRRRDIGYDLELPRHHRARTPRGVGGLIGGLSTDTALPVVELSRRLQVTEDEREL